MRVYNLSLKNIGPFREEYIEFITENDNIQTPPVTIITGENGTGKTIILDALRGIIGGQWLKLERDITSNPIFEIRSEIDFNSATKKIEVREKLLGNQMKFSDNKGLRKKNSPLN